MACAHPNGVIGKKKSLYAFLTIPRDIADASNKKQRTYKPPEYTERNITDTFDVYLKDIQRYVLNVQYYIIILS